MARLVNFTVDLDRFDSHGLGVSGICHDLNGLAFKIDTSASSYLKALEQREVTKPGSVSESDKRSYYERRRRAAFIREFSTWLWEQWKARK